MKLVEFRNRDGEKFLIAPDRVVSIVHVRGSIGAWPSYTEIRLEDGTMHCTLESVDAVERKLRGVDTLPAAV